MNNRIIKYLKRLIFGDENKFEIVWNSKNDGYSVKHLRGWLYINPDGFHYDPGAGISYSKSHCAAHSSIEDSKRFLSRWLKKKYGKTIDDIQLTVYSNPELISNTLK